MHRPRMFQRVVAAALVVAGGACRGGGSGGSGGGNLPQEQRDVSHDASHDASDQLLQLSAHPELEILIRTGTQHWQAGEITLVVHGSGTVEVSQRSAAATASFDGVLAKDELDALGRRLRQHRFTAPRSSALPREPGDTPLLLSLQRNGEVAFEAKLWSADRDGDADLDAILRAAEQLVHRTSRGQLGQP